MSNILRKLKRKITKKKIASFDVETKNKDNDFYMVGLYHDDNFEVFYDIDRFYDYIKRFLKGYWIVATNLNFDFTSCFQHSKYWNEFTIISNGGFMLMCESKKLGVRFIDTLNYHKASVKQLGDIVGRPKLAHPKFLGLREPQDIFEEKELIEYNRRDCEISYLFLLWFQDVVNKLGGDLKITIASTSLDVWRRKFNKHTLLKENYIMKQRKLDVDIQEKIFKAYYGGRTETVKRGYFKDLEYYDFNSLYPSVMINDLPDPSSVQYHKDGDIKHITTREGVSRVTVEHFSDELPLLPFRDERLIFPSGTFTGWYSHVELREAIANGYIIHNVHETISYTRKINLFSDFINTLYSMRTEAKKNNSSEQLIYKLIMNSTYGKFGERYHHQIKYFDLKNDDIKDDEIPEKCDNLILNDDGTGYYTEKKTCESAHVFPIIPVYITALARIKLWRKARLLDPVYMDTDSIVTSQKLSSSKKLGELDHEHHIDEGIFVRPKLYYFRDGDKDIVKAKGIPHCTKSQFYDILNKRDIYYDKFVKLKEGVKRGLKVNSIIKITKSIDIDDNKRIWSDRFNLSPEKSKPKILGRDKIGIKDKEENRQSIQVQKCVTDSWNYGSKGQSLI